MVEREGSYPEGVVNDLGLPSPQERNDNEMRSPYARRTKKPGPPPPPQSASPETPLTGRSEEVGGKLGPPFEVSIINLPTASESRPVRITRVDVCYGPLDWEHEERDHHFPVAIYRLVVTTNGTRDTVRVGGDGEADHTESWSAAWEEYLTGQALDMAELGGLLVLTGLQVRRDTVGNLTIVSGVALLTSLGKTYSFGASNGASRRLEAPAGRMVTGFFGRGANNLDAIGILWGPTPKLLFKATEPVIPYDPVPADAFFLIKTAQPSEPFAPLAHVLHDIKPFGKGSFGMAYACTLELVPSEAAQSEFFTKLQTLLESQPRLCLKMLELTITSSSRNEVLKEYSRETELHASLQHPNLVRFLGRLPPQRLGDREVCGYVMERADCTLSAYLNTLHHNDVMSVAERWQALRIVAVGIASGLEALHAHPLNIVHRDLHEENILVLNGRAIIADLGKGRALQMPRSKHLTEAPGFIVGIPPEAWGRDEGSEVEYDQSYDIYGLGLILLKLCICATMTKELYLREKRYMENGPQLGSDSSDYLRIPTWKQWLRDRAEASCRSLQETAYLAVAQQCVSESPTDRPKVGYIVTQLRDVTGA